MFQVISEKTLKQRFYKEFERFLYENNRNYNPYKFSYKVTFIPVLSFYRNQKQKSNFQHVGGLVTRNSFAFCL